MAQFFTNFDEYPVGDVTTSGQTDWAVKIANGTSDFRIIDGGDQDGKFLRINAASTNGSRVLAYNPLNGVSDNIETLVKFWIFKSGSDGSTGRYGASYIRYGGTTEAGTIGYAVSFVPVSSVKSLVLYEDSTGVVQYTNIAWSMSTDYFIRTRLSGSTRQVKIWAASSAEPGSWTFSSSATPPTIASPYSGVGTYQADSYLYVKQFSAGTGGDTAPMYATTDKTQTGQFRVVVPPPSSAPADGYSGGYGAGYGQGYATAFYPTATTLDKDQIGKFRVKITTDSNQIGKFRVRRIFDQSQVGTFRVKSTYNKTQLGQFRIKKTLDKLQSGAFRVKTTSDKNQIGRFTVRKILDNPQVGAFRISSEPLRVQVGVFRVKKLFDLTQIGRFVVSAPATKNQLGQFRVRKTVDAVQLGKFRVKTTLDKTQIGRFVVRTINVYSQTGQFRVTASVNKPQVGRFTVVAAIEKTQVGKFRVISIFNRSQIGNFRVQTRFDKTQVGRFLVKKTNTKDQIGQFRVEYLGLKHQTGKFRVYDKNTFPEVIVPGSGYIETDGSYGTIESATPESGLINRPIGENTGEILAASVDSGVFNFGTGNSGIIKSNNDFTILMFEEDYVWLSEDGNFILVQEYNKDDIINMISKEGSFTEGKIDNGTIQEAI